MTWKDPFHSFAFPILTSVLFNPEQLLSKGYKLKLLLLGIFKCNSYLAWFCNTVLGPFACHVFNNQEVSKRMQLLTAEVELVFVVTTTG